MNTMLDVECPFCQTLQSKDFRDINNKLGCRECRKGFSLADIRSGSEKNSFNALEQQITALYRSFYGDIMDIRDLDVRRNAQKIIDSLNENSKGQLLQNLRGTVQFPAAFHETLHRLLQLKIIRISGDPGSEFARLTK
jgi:protein-arginine kinase activator protein McsA